MKMSPHEQEAIVSILTRIYLDIREIEESCQLYVGDGDFRVRIEYFHDAVRAFTSLRDDPAAAARLSVELLAYDLRCLRYVQSMPLAGFKPSAAPLSASTAVAPHNSLARHARPDRETKQRLSELYQYYTVLFAAIFKPVADRDFADRVEELNQSVQDMAGLMQSLEKLGKGQGSVPEALAFADHLDDVEVSQAVRDFLRQKKQTDKQKLHALLGNLKLQSEKYDKDIKEIDDAHLHYASAQLGVYEEGKEIVKKMVAEGLNLAGRFVQNSMAAAQRDSGRGRR